MAEGLSFPFPVHGFVEFLLADGATVVSVDGRKDRGNFVIVVVKSETLEKFLEFVNGQEEVVVGVKLCVDSFWVKTFSPESLRDSLE